MSRAVKGFVYRPVVTYRDGDGRKRRRRGAFYWCSYKDSSGKRVRQAMKLPNGDGIEHRAQSTLTVSMLMRWVSGASGWPELLTGTL